MFNCNVLGSYDSSGSVFIGNCSDFLVGEQDTVQNTAVYSALHVPVRKCPIHTCDCNVLGSRRLLATNCQAGS